MPTRREILKLGAAAASMVSAKGQTLEAPLAELGYAAVQLADGPLETQCRENHRLLLNLSEDSMLRPFRVREGLPAPGIELGGWYGTYAFAPGATFGQWVSALARYHAITGDPATRAKIGRLVQGYAATASPQGKFYIENRFPSYTYDKLVCGLIDAHSFAGNPRAVDVLTLATNAAAPYLPPQAVPRQETEVLHGEDFTRHCWDESYTIPENQFLAWHRTGNPRYRELGERFLYNDGFFSPLARGENVLPGKHAYSHVNALSSAAQAYLSLNNPTYLRAAAQGFAMVQEQSYATAGWGPDEHFFEPGSGKLGASLTTTHNSFETPCGSYAHFKITRYLLRITRDPQYGDSMERVLYNTVLGAKPIQPDGSAFYYSDYNLQGHKFFHPDKWPCCSGSLPQVTADYRISAYFQHPRGLYVNLYVPSRVSWKQDATQCALHLTTGYPYSSHLQFEIDTPRSQTFSVFLRIPGWATGARASVNGLPDSLQPAPGTFAEIRREWKRGDRIELDLPLTMRLEPVDARHPNLCALLCGPLVLMALDGSGQPDFTKAALLAAAQTTPGEWRVQSGARLRPFPDIAGEPYTTYLKIRPA